MLINPSLPTESATSILLQSRTDASTGAMPQPSAGTYSASQIDPSLQRLTDAPIAEQDADWELQDEAGATASVQSATNTMLQQPGSALGAQANQLSENVLSLLQPAD
jgi:hypothetical protein